MKKFVFLLIIISMVLFVNMVYAQDCGKCPSKDLCNTSTKVQKAAETDPIVYIKKDDVQKLDKFYHLKDCKLVLKAAKDSYKPVKLSEAAKLDLKPCTECKPAPLPPQPANNSNPNQNKKQ